MTLPEILAGCLGAAAGLLVLLAGWALAAWRHERWERERLEHWIRSSLVIIQAHCGSTSPEVLTVVRSLQCALPILAKLDGPALEKHVFLLRMQRDATLLRHAPAAKGPR